MKIRKIFSLAFCLGVSGLLLPLRPSAALETTNLANGSEVAGKIKVVSNVASAETSNHLVVTNKPVATKHRDNPQPIVLFGQDADLKAGDSAEAVVVIGGNATIHGRVREAVVVIGGNAEVDGEVGEAVVAVGGDVHLKSGASVREDAVSVLGSVSVEPGVTVKGNAVAVGGKLNLADGAVVKGDKVNVGFPRPFGNVEWLRNWFRYCVFELRPLAFQVGFVWVIAAVFFLIYLFVAAVFSRPIQKSVEDLNHRPATIFLVGLLTKLIVPFVHLILIATGVGVIAVPIIGVTVFLFSIYGKVAILEWLGFKIGRFFGNGVQKPLVAFLIGTMAVTLLYLIPIVGFLAYLIFGIWGLGSGVMTVFGRARRETPQSPEPPAGAMPLSVATPSESPQAPPVIQEENTPPASAASVAFVAPDATGHIPPKASQPQSAASTQPISADVTSYPKANLWERLLAALLDIVLIGLVTGFIHLGKYSLIIALVYFTLMWMWRGTSIGGILLKLKVVRTDGRPLTFMVCLVRGLAAAFSIIVLFLGFLWIAWDKDKQGWHDKIAGTVVVRLPQSAPLVCL